MNTFTNRHPEIHCTPLYEEHLKLGAKMVPFAGWEMPVQYKGVIEEHNSVRNSAGIFDVSHMGEIFIEGTDATKAVDYLVCNDITKLKDNDAQYNALLTPEGAVIDDLIVYKFNSQKYLLCVNASNKDKDFEWIKSNNKYKVEITDKSDFYSLIAFQGKKSFEILGMTKEFKDILTLKYFSFKIIKYKNHDIICAYTGYTGEKGFELFVPNEIASELWNFFLELKGVSPCGLGARDSLRLEACYPLHGHELSESVSALESGLGWIVKFNKSSDFIGKKALSEEKSSGIKNSLIAFELLEPGISRQGDEVYAENSDILLGTVTSGTKTPTINKSIGLAIVNSKYSEIDTVITFKVRGRFIKGKIVKAPFYTSVKD